MINTEFWKGKKIFITGHTGFKGSWLCLWLASLGADVVGVVPSDPSPDSLFKLARVNEFVRSVSVDVRDRHAILAELSKASPEIVIHMASHPILRDSYKIPVETFELNVMGTVHLLEAVRSCPSVKAVVNVTTDKVYENREWVWGYRENEQLGGYDPYSSSKACSELATAAYRSSFFNPVEYDRHGVAVATVRASNVIGGGDWSADRLVPDIIRSILSGEKVQIRNPNSVRTWQHVLEPLYGYLMLIERLYSEGAAWGEAWNFGPSEENTQSVGMVVQQMCALWGNGADYTIDKGEHPHEVNYLKLDSSKARARLTWKPRWDLAAVLHSIIEWTRVYAEKGDINAVCLRQINEYQQCSNA